MGDLTNMGSYTGSASPYGTFDQGGNVWEWNEVPFVGDSHRGIRGGDFQQGHIRLAASNRYRDYLPTSDDVVIGFRVAMIAPVTIDWTLVGDPGNACDTQSQGCFGAVGYAYNIGTYEVTNAQYAEFLNAKAASDPLGLYNTNMGSSGSSAASRAAAARAATRYSAIAGRERHAGELRVVLRRAALRELAEQRPGQRRHRDGRLHAARRDARSRATARR